MTGGRPSISTQRPGPGMTARPGMIAPAQGMNQPMPMQWSDPYARPQAPQMPVASPQAAFAPVVIPQQVDPGPWYQDTASYTSPW